MSIDDLDTSESAVDDGLIHVTVKARLATNKCPDVGNLSAGIEDALGSSSDKEFVFPVVAMNVETEGYSLNPMIQEEVSNVIQSSLKDESGNLKSELANISPNDIQDAPPVGKRITNSVQIGDVAVSEDGSSSIGNIEIENLLQLVD